MFYQMATPEPIRDPILERPLPSSPETERAILGAIILDNSLIAQTVELLKPADFYVPSHRRIFTAMIALFERSSEINPRLMAFNAPGRFITTRATLLATVDRTGFSMLIGTPSFLAGTGSRFQLPACS